MKSERTEAQRTHKVNIIFHSLKSHVFFQFILIFVVILCFILLSSTSFYTTIITNMTVSNLRKSIEEAENISASGEDVFGCIGEIERKRSVFIEVYGKNPEDGKDEFTKIIYTKYTSDRYYCTGEQTEHIKSTHPLIGYLQGSFDVEHTYDSGCAAGKLTNTQNDYEYFALVSPGSDNTHLYIAVVPYSTIEIQSETMSITIGVLFLLIFIMVSIVVFFYISQLTNSFKSITDMTQRMAAADDPNLRIPYDENIIISNETKTAIVSINAMYSSWMNIKAKLAERSQTLLDQLREKELEQKYREEFIAGTSHELKTPISIIQGYAEGAKYILDDKESLNEYCDTIIDECGRMNDLVMSMITLSDIRQNSDSLKIERISITDFISDNLASHSIVFKKYGITAKNLITDRIYGLYSVEKLPFVMNNLISNAISYIGGDPKIIRIRYEDKGSSYRIFIYNTGENIPDEVLEKIWFSFYRHDTARERSEGHFGLGLSIVKSISDAHGEQCGVNNADGGVEFWFDIKKDL